MGERCVEVPVRYIANWLGKLVPAEGGIKPAGLESAAGLKWRSAA
jgi:hypothetical protein